MAFYNSIVLVFDICSFLMPRPQVPACFGFTIVTRIHKCDSPGSAPFQLKLRWTSPNMWYCALKFDKFSLHWHLKKFESINCKIVFSLELSVFEECQFILQFGHSSYLNENIIGFCQTRCAQYLTLMKFVSTKMWIVIYISDMNNTRIYFVQGKLYQYGFFPEILLSIIIKFYIIVYSPFVIWPIRKSSILHNN